jgi:membrane-bound lytic murein transglycosylase D
MMNDDDRTIVMPAPAPGDGQSAQSIVVRYRDAAGREQVQTFHEVFAIGRDSTCAIQIGGETVSRRHVEILPQGQSWVVRDLNSTNGTWINGRRVTEQPLEQTADLQLGEGGPFVRLEVPGKKIENPATGESSRGAIEDVRRYVDPTYSGPMGDHTRMVRLAFLQEKKKQSRNYLYVLALVGTVLAGALSYAVYQEIQLRQLKNLTVDIFYNMKTLELQVAKLESSVPATGNTGQADELTAMRSQLKTMENQYDAYLDKVGLFSKDLSEEDRLIFHVARIFGECEVNMPKEFASEVKKYIAKWQGSNRLANAIVRAQRNGYTEKIRNIMVRHYLPPQFFYLGLQESGYQREIVGPSTPYGIAKGIWQFIPTTATRYGLKTGPLLDVRSFDPMDERFDFIKATNAAAAYLRDIYTTQAQASGLLVIASYNWGENKVINLIEKLPENPRERNLWALLRKYKIPEETYDYVYYIFSAAVIGENPRLFGFDFDNPLAPAAKSSSPTRLDSGAH